MIRSTAFFMLFSGLASGLPADDKDVVEHISEVVPARSGLPVRLRPDESITTKQSFKPPVEIQVEAKTDSTNLRLSYAADQLIFNWERAKNELRVDGGPAAGKHKMGAGMIPVNKYVTVRWVVTPDRQQVYVDNQLRYEHIGDYSKIDKPVGVYSAHGSTVTVKSIKVRQLPAAAR
jgi:hypothetical protein